jgi:hypothetical protein
VAARGRRRRTLLCARRVAVRHQRYAGREDNDLILWLPSINAIVTGESLSDFGHGLDIQLGGRKSVTRDDVARRLRLLLDLPVELVLPVHGEPTDRAALERALS